jgi:hypothetical protein
MSHRMWVLVRSDKEIGGIDASAQRFLCRKESLRRFNVLPTGHCQLSATENDASGAPQPSRAAKFVAARMGVCIF